MDGVAYIACDECLEKRSGFSIALVRNLLNKSIYKLPSSLRCLSSAWIMLNLSNSNSQLQNCIAAIT